MMQLKVYPRKLGEVKMNITLRQRTKREILPFLPKAFIEHYLICRKNVNPFYATWVSLRLCWLMFKTAPNEK